MNFSELVLLLWDEISMTSKSQFARALNRLIKLCSTETGSKCRVYIVLFGDIFQLPPVRASYLFQEPVHKVVHDITTVNNEEETGYIYWLDFKDVVMLDENMRQGSDKKYGDTLKRLRTGEMTSKDITYLNTRVWSPRENKSVHQKQLESLISSRRNIFVSVHTNENRHAMNWACVCEEIAAQKIQTPIICIAEISKSGKSRKPTQNDVAHLLNLGDERTERLPSLQIISKGLPVQISENCAVEVGVANGKLGTIIGCEFDRTATFQSIDISGTKMYSASCLPRVVYVDIPSLNIKRRLKYVPENCPLTTYPLLPITKQVTVEAPNRQFKVSMKQFPYSVSYVVTTYKLQGCTLDAIYFPKIRGKGSKPTSLYVNLSRVKTSKGLFLQRIISDEDRKHFRPDKSVVEENERLIVLHNATLQRIQRFICRKEDLKFSLQDDYNSNSKEDLKISLQDDHNSKSFDSCVGSDTQEKELVFKNYNKREHDENQLKKARTTLRKKIKKYIVL